MTDARGRQPRGGLLSDVYGRITRLRRLWYARPSRRRRLNHHVISVGNLSVGGSGKTPVVAALARLLKEHGQRPVVLTRGYGRRETAEGVLVVSDGTRVLEPVTRSGDEPQLLARTLTGVPVLVSANRYIAGLFAEKQFGATVSILDDGFQHVQLARDVDLLLVSSADLVERGLPSGRLREPLGTASIADALLVAGTEDDVVTVAAALGHHTVFRIATHYAALQRVQKESGGRVLSGPPVLSDPPIRVIAFAGIARPERFFNALRSLGYDVVRELTFRDHHWYSSRDVEMIRAAARDTGASLVVTTEKDAVRCDIDAAVLPMTVSIEPASDFERWLLDRLDPPLPQPRNGGRG